MAFMDWIRRNWPDLLIGFALLAVISGIVATLLTGGSFFSSGSSTPPPAQVQAADTRNTERDPPAAARDGEGESPDRTAAAVAAEDEPVDPFAELAEAEAEAAAASAAAAAEEDGGQEELPAVVALRPGATADTPAPADGGAGTAGTPPTQEPAEPAGETAAAPAAAPAQESAGAGSPVAPAAGVSSGTAPSQAEPYTVGVGAFRAADNAERQAAVFRQAGYPVIVAAQDELSVVLLGPYTNRSEAERIRDTVNAEGFDVDAIVYTYQGGGDSAAAGTEDAAGTAAEVPAAAPAAGQPAAAAPVPTASAATSGRYLQVGAYSSDGNAAAQRTVLENLGYDVVERQDGNLIRILVGPWPEEQLSGARDRLAGQGIDSVPY